MTLSTSCLRPFNRRLSLDSTLAFIFSLKSSTFARSTVDCSGRVMTRMGTSCTSELPASTNMLAGSPSSLIPSCRVQAGASHIVPKRWAAVMPNAHSVFLWNSDFCMCMSMYQCTQLDWMNLLEHDTKSHDGMGSLILMPAPRGDSASCRAYVVLLFH